MSNTPKTPQSESSGPVPFFSWMLALFGTAVGAGILFLPIQAGQGGLLVLGLAVLLVWPTVDIGHRLYALIPSRAKPGADFSTAVADRAPWLAVLLRLLFLTFLLVLLIAYGIALTNDIGELLATHAGFSAAALPRPWLGLAILLPLLSLLGFARRWLVPVLGGLSLVLILLLVTVTLALMPDWRWEITQAALAVPSPRAALTGLLILYPLLTLSFMFFPGLSSLVADLRERLPDRAERERRQRQLISATTLLLLGFVLAFVLSFMLAIPAPQFVLADQHNISALALVGELFRAGLIGHLAPVVSVTALTTSFIGIYLGYRLALLNLLPARLGQEARRAWRTDAALVLATFALLWPLVILNLPVMDLLGDLVAPLGAIFLLLVPASLVLLADDLHAERGPAAWFSVVAGAVVVVAYFLGQALSEPHSRAQTMIERLSEQHAIVHREGDAQPLQGALCAAGVKMLDLTAGAALEVERQRVERICVRQGQDYPLFPVLIGNDLDGPPG